MNKIGKKHLTLAMLLFVSLALTLAPLASVSAAHNPSVTIDPKYFNAEWPEWKYFDIENLGEESDPIVIVSIVFPETDPAYKPDEYYKPDGWTIDYNIEDRKVTFTSTNYAAYNITAEATETFGIHFIEGPMEDGDYEFAITTTDTKEEGYTRYEIQTIDTIDPIVEIIYPSDEDVIRGPGIWINATAEDNGLVPSGILWVPLYIDDEYVGAMTYDASRDVYYWYNDTLSKGERLWYNTRAAAYDNAGNFGLSAIVSFFWYVTWGIGISPTSGPVGTTVTVTGIGFTPGSDVDVTFYNTIDHGVVATALTDAQTMFETSFDVPETPKGSYTVNATDSEGFSDTKTFEVVPWITISPTSGPVDTLIEVSGTGFPDDTDVYIWWGGFASDRLDYATTTYLTWNGSWTFRICTVGGDLLVAAVESNDKGSFTTSFLAPESWGGFHPVWAEVGGVPTFQEQIFRILPSMEIDPSSGVSGQYVNLKGKGWAYWGDYSMWNDANANLEWNECEQGFHYRSEGVGLVVDFGPNERYIDEAHFILNGEADLAWFDKVYDPVGLDARGTIIYRETQHHVVGAIGSPFLQVPFLQPGDYDVTVYRFIEWEKMLDRHPGREPYEIVLFENHHIYSYVESASTTFTIEPLQIDDSEILSMLDELNATLVNIQGRIVTIETDIGTIQTDISSINGEITSIDGRLVTIETDIGMIQTDISDINGELTSIDGRLATVETDIGTIQVDISDLGAVSIEEIKGDIATIRSDIGDTEASLSDINAKITVINDNVATIETDIGTIEGRLTSIEGDVATIETDIGTAKASLDDIEGTTEEIKTDTSLQPATVALSLIAAIAAIAAAVMVLRKVYVK